MAKQPTAALEAAEATESAAPARTAEDAAKALAWLDATLEELGGALAECGACIDAEVLDPAVVSSRMNSLVMQMMAGGQ